MLFHFSFLNKLFLRIREDGFRCHFTICPIDIFFLYFRYGGSRRSFIISPIDIFFLYLRLRFLSVSKLYRSIGKDGFRCYYIICPIDICFLDLRCHCIFASWAGSFLTCDMVTIVLNRDIFFLYSYLIFNCQQGFLTSERTSSTPPSLITLSICYSHLILKSCFPCLFISVKIVVVFVATLWCNDIVHLM